MEWIVLLVFCGAVAMAGMSLARRKLMQLGVLSSLQVLIIANTFTTVLFAVVYVTLYGFAVPQGMRVGLSTAVVCGASVNALIQYFNVRAASLHKGEVSLTAPLQAMTPGLITFLAVLLGEYPSWVGVLGIGCMALGSYILLLEKSVQGRWSYIGPIRRIGLLLSSASDAETRERSLVVLLALGSALLGTFGLLFDGLYARRSGSFQGLLFAAMCFVALLAVIYIVWYAVKPDAKKSHSWNNLWHWIALGCLVIMASLWVLHVVLINTQFTETYVAYVGTLKRFSVLVSAVLAIVIFKEADAAKRLWAAVWIVIGAILIGLEDLPSKLSHTLEGLGL